MCVGGGGSDCSPLPHHLETDEAQGPLGTGINGGPPLSENPKVVPPVGSEAGQGGELKVARPDPKGCPHLKASLWWGENPKISPPLAPSPLCLRQGHLCPVLQKRKGGIKFLRPRWSPPHEPLGHPFSHPHWGMQPVGQLRLGNVTVWTASLCRALSVPQFTLPACPTEREQQSRRGQVCREFGDRDEPAPSLWLRGSDHRVAWSTSWSGLGLKGTPAHASC